MYLPCHLPLNNKRNQFTRGLEHNLQRAHLTTYYFVKVFLTWSLKANTANSLSGRIFSNLYNLLWANYFCITRQMIILLCCIDLLEGSWLAYKWFTMLCRTKLWAPKKWCHYPKSIGNVCDMKIAAFDWLGCKNKSKNSLKTITAGHIFRCYYKFEQPLLSSKSAKRIYNEKLKYFMPPLV